MSNIKMYFYLKKLYWNSLLGMQYSIEEYQFDDAMYYYMSALMHHDEVKEQCLKLTSDERLALYLF